MIVEAEKVLGIGARVREIFASRNVNVGPVVIVADSAIATGM